MGPDSKEQEVSSETVPVLVEVFPGRPDLREPQEPMGILGFQEPRENPEMEELQASVGSQDLPARQGLAVVLVVKERRAPRTIPPWVWE